MHNFCPRCRGWVGQEATGESGIYQSHGVSDLHEACFLEEDAQIESEGTNNLPDVLMMYRRNDEELNGK